MKLLKISFVGFLACVIGVIACHKSGHDQQSTTAAINIQGFELTDFSGNLLGWQGTPDSDWYVQSDHRQLFLKIQGGGLHLPPAVFIPRGTHYGTDLYTKDRRETKFQPETS